MQRNAHLNTEYRTLLILKFDKALTMKFRKVMESILQ